MAEPSRAEAGRHLTRHVFTKVAPGLRANRVSWSDVSWSSAMVGRARDAIALGTGRRGLLMERTAHDVTLAVSAGATDRPSSQRSAL